MNKDDWRRSNVDSIIEMMSRVIKEEKPYCKFGISPFGVWRNKAKIRKEVIQKPDKQIMMTCMQIFYCG